MRNHLTVSEVAKDLGITPSMVRHLIATGVIRSEMAGGVHLIAVSEVEKAKARRTKKGPEPKAKG